jgi:HlyD family secretion protein
MAAPSRIFRQAALDRLASPEQLDQLLQVTAPRSWLALSAAGLVVVAAVVWGLGGTIHTKVSGRGILIKQGGVFVVSSRGEGNVAEILVREGQTVTSNQVLARLYLPELDLKLRQARFAGEKLEQEYQALLAYQAEEARKEKEDQEHQLQTYQAMVQDYQVQTRALEERAASQAELFARQSGVVSKVHLLETSNLLFAAQHDLARAQIQIKQIGLSQLQANERRRQQRQEKQTQIRQGLDEFEYLARLHKLNSEVLSPFRGTVLEITVKVGQLISPNTPVMSLQAEQEKLEARLFLPPAEGKRVQPNMPVRLAPVSVKKELFGLMSGRVSFVSEFPATPQLMLRILENPALVSEFSAGGAPIAVVVELDTDPETESGFRWTSGTGPKVKITSGTLCDGTITVASNRPIRLVLPRLKE